MKGVVLDADSLGGELDWQALRGLPIEWQIFPATTAEDLVARIRGAEVVLSNKVMLDAAAIAASPQLKLIAVMATGTNNVDLAAASAAGIQVSNAVGYGTASVVQHTWALILALTTRLKDYNRAAVDGRWQQSPFFCLLDYPVIELAGKQLGVIGLGELGGGVAAIGRAMGMTVAAWQQQGREYAPEPGLTRMPLNELLASSDVISIHCPLNDATRDLISTEQFALMPRHALLVNTARGGIVNEAALKQALIDGQIAGAATDVLTKEPPREGNVLLDSEIPNFIVTPHMAWIARESRQRLLDQVAGVVAGYLKQEKVNAVGV